LLPVLRRPVLNADPLTFEEGIKIAKKSERIERQLGSLDNEHTEFVRYSDTRDTVFHVAQNPSTSQVRTREISSGTKDRITVQTQPSVARADTRMCFKCEKIGHIAKFCKAQQRPRDETVPTCSRSGGEHPDQHGLNVSECETELVPAIPSKPDANVIELSAFGNELAVHTDGLIGLDFLRKFKARVDYNANKIELGNACLKIAVVQSVDTVSTDIRVVEPIAGTTSQNVVRLKENLVLPARSEVVCLGIRQSSQSDSETIMIEPVEIPIHGILAARVVARTGTRDVAVKLMNVSQTALNVPGKTIIGLEETVTEGSITTASVVNTETVATVQDKNVEELFELEHLSTENRRDLLEILMNYTDIFRFAEMKLGCTSKVSHRIITEDVHPIARAPYRAEQDSDLVVQRLKSQVQTGDNEFFVDHEGLVYKLRAPHEREDKLVAPRSMWNKILRTCHDLPQAGHEATGETPFFLLHGREFQMPFDDVLAPQRTRSHTDESYPTELSGRLHQAYILVREKLQIAAEKNERQYNKKTRPVELKEGDFAYLLDVTIQPGLSRKLGKPWKGPYKLVKRTSPVNFVIKDISSGKEQVVHVNRLKLCRSEVAEEEEEIEEKPPDVAPDSNLFDLIEMQPVPDHLTTIPDSDSEHETVDSESDQEKLTESGSDTNDNDDDYEPNNDNHPRENEPPERIRTRSADFNFPLLFMLMVVQHESIGKANELDKGLVFVKNEEILLTGDKWILTTDVHLNTYISALDMFGELVDNVTQIDVDLGKNIEPTLVYTLNEIIEKETNIIRSDVSRLKVKLANLVKTVAPYNPREKRGLVNVGGR
ncbi:hypothetical protein CBL_20071, partial [Carabus blaptoides fortunei]